MSFSAKMWWSNKVRKIVKERKKERKEGRKKERKKETLLYSPRTVFFIPSECKNIFFMCNSITYHHNDIRCINRRLKICQAIMTMTNLSFLRLFNSTSSMDLSFRCILKNKSSHSSNTLKILLQIGQTYHQDTQTS